MVTSTTCMLSCFSHVLLYATLWTVAHQVLLSMGFSRQEDYSGLPCPPAGDLSNPGIKPTSLTFPSLAGKYITTTCVLVVQSYPTLCNCMDCNLPGSSIHGILWVRTLEWIAIPFSRGSSWLRDQTLVSCTASRFFTLCATGKSFTTTATWKSTTAE